MPLAGGGRAGENGLNAIAITEWAGFVQGYSILD